MLVDVDHLDGIHRSGFVNMVAVGRLERVDCKPDWPSMVAVDRTVDVHLQLVCMVVDAVGLDTAEPNVCWKRFLLVQVYCVRGHPIQRVCCCYCYWWVVQAHLVQTVDGLVAVAPADVALADVAEADVELDDVAVAVDDEYFYGHANRHSSVPHDHSLELYFWCHRDV